MGQRNDSKRVAHNLHSSLLPYLYLLQTVQQVSAMDLRAAMGDVHTHLHYQSRKQLCARLDHYSELDYFEHKRICPSLVNFRGQV
jgi:hypothetical protein